MLGFLGARAFLPTLSVPQENEEQTITLMPEDKINVSSDHRRSGQGQR